MACITLTKDVALIICSNIPEEILTISALGHLALGTNQEVPYLSNIAYFISLTELRTLLTLSREWAHALCACFVATLTKVILIISPVAIWADLPTTLVEHIVTSVTRLTLCLVIWPCANLTLLRAREALI